MSNAPLLYAFEKCLCRKETCRPHCGPKVQQQGAPYPSPGPLDFSLSLWQGLFLWNSSLGQFLLLLPLTLYSWGCPNQPRLASIWLTPQSAQGSSALLEPGHQPPPLPSSPSGRAFPAASSCCPEAGRILSFLDTLQDPCRLQEGEHIL